MQWSDISFAPTNRQLRQFAGMWLVFFGALACWQGFLRGNTWTAVVFGAMAVAMGTLGLVRPQAIRLVFVGAMILAFPIGFVVSRVVLAVIFYGVFTPVGLIFKIIGRDAMERTRRPEAITYWTVKRQAPGAESYFRQF